MKTMLFNPYTGKPRHPSDIASDPEGRLMTDPDQPLFAAVFVPPVAFASLVEELEAAAVAIKAELRQMIGELLSQKLTSMCEDGVAPDWCDSRHIDELLDVLIPIVQGEVK